MMKKRNAGIGICIGAVLMLALIIWFVKSRETTYTCEKLPIYNGKLSWGMDADEVISLIGEADTRKEDADGLALIYEGDIPCEFGEASALTLYFGCDNLKNSDGKSYSSGLCNMVITFDYTTKKAVLSDRGFLWNSVSFRGKHADGTEPESGGAELF